MTVSIVVVSGTRPAEEALAAVPPADGHEIVDRITADGDASAGFAVAVTRGVASCRGRYVLVLPSDVDLEPGWAPALVALLEAHPEVAAVAPQLRDADGRLVTPSPLAALGRVGDEQGAGPFGCLLVRRSAFVAIGAIDAGAVTAAEAGRALALAWADLDLRVAYQPAVTAVDRAPHRSGGGFARPGAQIDRQNGRARVVGPFDRVLLVHDRVPALAGPLPDRRVFQFLRQMRALWPSSDLAVVALDGHQARRHGPALAELGVEVAAGPRDWERWFGERRLQFSYIFVTGAGVLHRLEHIVGDTQPQATTVLWTGIPDRWMAQSMESFQHPDELDGLRAFEWVLRERFAAAARRADAVWCSYDEDARLLESVAPATRCDVVPFMGERICQGPAFAARDGFVTLGLPEADIVAAHEDAAIAAVTEVLPLLHGRGAAPPLRIATREPSPVVQRLAQQGATLAWVDTDPTKPFQQARVCLAPYRFGTGGRWAIELALASGTPFVTTRLGAFGLDFGDLDPLLVADDMTSLAQLAWDLHRDEERWTYVHERLLTLAAARHSEAALRRAVATAGAAIGLVPSDDPASWPVPTIDRSGRGGPQSVEPTPGRMLRFVPVPRQLPIDRGALLPDIHELSDTEQYRMWLDRHGPTPAVLSSVRFALEQLSYKPKLSVVMPTYNTDPDVLTDAVESVLAQVYDNFELCIADDASSREETLGLLRHYAADERVHVRFLEENRGIAGATNAALELATGDYIGFLDHDDELKPHALAEIVRALNRDAEIDVFYTDWDMRDPDGTLVQPFFKPGWSPDMFRSRNYICHFLVVRKTVLDEVGGLRLTFDGSQDYDLALRLLERTERIGHIAEPLYTWRKVPGSVASVPEAKPYAFEAAKRALADALRRRGTPGEARDGAIVSAYRVKYDIPGEPLVSVIIATRDRLDLLEPCISSIVEKSTYANYEIVVVDNQSAKRETHAYLADFPGRVIRYDHKYNYARIQNFGAAQVDGDLLLFLNNDTEVLAEDWLEALIEHAMRPEVGGVGARLIYPDGRVQHEGIGLGLLGGVAANIAFGGWWGNGDIVRNCSAVTAACLMVRPSVFWQVGGFDEHLRVAYNDVDLGLRIRQAGYENVYTPYARLIHNEGASRKGAEPSEDELLFAQRWRPYEFVDQYYNPHLDPYRPFNIRLEADAAALKG